MNALSASVLIILVLTVLFIAGILLDIYTGIKVKHPELPEGLFKTGMNRLRYFTSGRELFNDMEGAIRNARSHIHLSFFIFEADDVGNEWLDLLKKKAGEGVEVRLIVDSLNGGSVRKKKGELTQAGVQIAFSGRTRFPFTFYYLNRRNHRKIAVIDGRTGFFGGFNVSREYIGNRPEMGPWHDNHLKVEGGSVADLQRLFLEDWRLASGQKAGSPAFFPPAEKGPSSLALIATSGKQIEDIFAEKFGAARSSIIIGSPYFIPSCKLMDVLLDCLGRGVELTILLPMKKDHPFVKPASYLYLQPLVEKGARLYHFYQGFYHSKVFVTDQRLCYIGTANFDRRSFFWNDELSGFTEDPALILDVLGQLNKEIHEGSVAVTLETIRKRSPLDKLKSACSGRLSPFL